MRYQALHSSIAVFRKCLTLVFSGAVVYCTPAATVWNGPTVTYNQPAPDPTQAVNQDRLTAHVWLTRAASKGLFNSVTETAATANSPADTEWAFGTLDNYASLTYTNWLAWLNGQSPTNLVGQQTVVHLISDDTYIAVQFTFWGSHASGGFAYQRTTPPSTSLSGGTMVAGQFSFNYTASPGLTYVVQSSPNLADWNPISTNVASSNPVHFTDESAPSSRRFFRVMRVLNP